MKDVKKPIKRLKPRKENDGGKEENKVKALVTSKIVEIDDLADLAPKRMFLFKPRVVSARFCYIP